MVYVLIVIRRARRQRDYQPVLEDWIWHFILPLLAYTVFFVSAIFMTLHPIALFAVGAGSLLLVFIGIHNAWDTVTYIALGMGASEETGPNDGDRRAPEAGGAERSVAARSS